MGIQNNDQLHHRANLNDSSEIRKIPYQKSEAVKLLEEMANKAAQEKYPNTPPEWLAPRKYRDDTANRLTKCIIHYIRLTGGQAERISYTGRQITRNNNYVDVVGFQRSIINTHWIPGTGSKGTADISATIEGKSVKIEVKIGRDKQSAAQKQYQQNLESAGGIYLIATNFQSFYDWHKVFNNENK